MNPTTDKTKFLHRGARMERLAITRKLKRELAGKQNPDIPGVVWALKYMLLWIEDRDRRYAKRAGGLGRPKKVKAKAEGKR
jgi:hypothetical protein